MHLDIKRVTSDKRKRATSDRKNRVTSDRLTVPDLQPGHHHNLKLNPVECSYYGMFNPHQPAIDPLIWCVSEQKNGGPPFELETIFSWSFGTFQWKQFRAALSDHFTVELEAMALWK